MHSTPWSLAALLVAGALAGCATPQGMAPPRAPPALRPAADQTLYLEALATGVQIYACAQKPDASFEWAFKAPEATLQTRSGVLLGQHYAGPTWESVDGSKVVGEVKAKDAGPTASAIPWLLLSARTHSGAGTFGAARSIQRLATVGGMPPGEACTASEVGQTARVPYTATYYFYR